MRIGIIGIGDICKKTYRIAESVTCVADLVECQIDAAFVHTSTDSHFEICTTLLEHSISVYVDKPISYHYLEALALYELASKKGVKLMVGFNRRFAPKFKELPSLGSADIIIMEKNRINLPGDVRVFIYDDFIHVLDTIRFLMGADYQNITVDYKQEHSKLINIVVKLSNENTTALAIMNRNNGITEETVEYMCPSKKVVVTSLVESTLYENNTKSIQSFADWDNTLYKRGFFTLVNGFLDAIQNNTPLPLSIEDSLKTHKLCEDLVQMISLKK